MYFLKRYRGLFRYKAGTIFRVRYQITARIDLLELTFRSLAMCRKLADRSQVNHVRDRIMVERERY